ncbi:hypothetical protein D9M70_400790 [compost metagenome]
MTHRQHRQQGLVQGTDAHLGEQRLLAVVGQPGVALCRGRGVAWIIAAVRRLPAGFQDALAKAVHQLSRTMGENQRRLRLLVVQPPVDLPHPLVHLVGGGHARQGEIQPMGHALLHQPLGQDKRGLGFAGACHVFQQEQLWPCLQGHVGGITLQRCGLLQIVEQLQWLLPVANRLGLQPCALHRLPSLRQGR